MTIAQHADNEQTISPLGDLLADIMLDRLANAAPECMSDLLAFADRVIEVA